MRFQFYIEVESGEIRELLFGNKLEQLMSTLKPQLPMVEETGEIINGHNTVKMMGAEPAPASVSFDAVAVSKTLTDLRTTMINQRKVVTDANVLLSKNTQDFENEVKIIGTSLKMKVGEERFLQTVVDSVPYVIKITQPNLGTYGCAFIKQG